jgi:ABC-type sulfate transport system substrate-binding protein
MGNYENSINQQFPTAFLVSVEGKIGGWDSHMIEKINRLQRIASQNDGIIEQSEAGGGLGSDCECNTL